MSLSMPLAREGLVPPAPVAAQGLAAEFSAALVRDREGFENLCGAWDALEARVPGSQLFQSAAWARAVFAHEEMRGRGRFDPVIATLHHQGRLIAVMPMERVVEAGLRALVPLGRGYAQYSGVMADPGFAMRPVADALLDVVVKAVRCDVIHFRKLRADSRFAPLLAERARAIGPVLFAPAVNLAPWEDFAAYFGALKAKSRKTIRNDRNRLERAAPLAHNVAATQDARLAVVQRTLGGRSERLAAEGLTSRAFSDPDFHRFCALLAESRSGHPEVLAMSLSRGDVPIAEQWGLVHRGCYYAYVSSRDFTASEVSPGKVHLMEVLRTAYALNLRSVDMLVPAMPYKLMWATEVAEIRDYAVPVTISGALVTRVYDGWLRPLAKGLAGRMPAGLRRLLVRSPVRR